MPLITDEFLLIAAIAGWDFFLEWVGFRFLVASRFTERHEVSLVIGELHAATYISGELITEGKLLSPLRQHCIAGVDQIRWR